MMQAIIECVERNAGAAESVRQAPMNRLDRGEADLALGVARLVRDQNEAIPGLLEQSEPLENPPQQLKVLGPMRRFIGAVTGLNTLLLSKPSRSRKTARPALTPATPISSRAA